MPIDLLESALPKRTEALLLVGAGEETARRLGEQGHRVLSRSPSELDLDRLDRGEEPPFLAPEHADAGQLADRDSAPLAAIVILNHRLSASPLGLFNAAYDRLAADGRLVLTLDAGSDPSHPDSRPVRPRLDCLIDLASRCGFALADPAPTAGHDTVQIVLRKCDRPPRWRLAALAERDLDQFVRLFRKSFQVEITPALWRWKYGDGRGWGILARRGDKAVAHYGCTRRRAIQDGRPITALQMCDVMVDPRERGVMTKQGAMFTTAAAMTEIYLGLKPGGLAFGFPNNRHARLGERLGLYAEVDQVREVHWPALPDKPRLRTRLRPFRPDHPADRRAIDRLWQAMRRDLREAILVVRDRPYLRERYLEHPHHQYELILVSGRLTHRPLGLLVLRKLADSLELLDIVAPLQRIPSLIDQARRLAGHWACPRLFCWTTSGHLPHFAGAEASVTDPEISVPTIVWLGDLDVAAIAGRWWLMSGDTDFH